MYTVEKLLSSLCDPKNCLEKRAIIFDSRKSHVLHFRIDGVFITDNNIQKNDCLAIYNQPDSQQISFLFLAEVKKSSYTIDEVVAQLQTSRDILNDLFHTLRKFNSVHAVYQLLPKFHQKKATASLVLQSFQRIRKNQYRFIPILCAKKNKSIYRRILSPRFKIRNGKDTIPIVYLERNTDVIAAMYRKKYIE